MTTATLSGTPDVPVSKVNAFGPTEAVSLLVTVGGVLAALFGRDWGISAHAEAIVSLGYIVGPAVLGLSRALKHHSVNLANATVIAAKLAQSAAPLIAAPAEVSAGKHAADDAPVGADLPTLDLTGA